MILGEHSFPTKFILSLVKEKLICMYLNHYHKTSQLSLKLTVDVAIIDKSCL